MKKRTLFVSIIALFTLSGCDFIDNILARFKQPQKQEETSENEEQKKEENKEQEQDPPIPKTKIGEFYGGVVEGDTYTGYEFSKSQSDIERPRTGVGELNIYAFNDFHGSIVETEDEVGLKYLATFFKDKSKKQNTLILDQGDTWQGSFESNYQYGSLVQDVFNYAGVSMRTVGNHDFDWGLNKLESIINRKIDDDYIPTLASNVFDYANGVNGHNQQKQYGKEYAIFSMDNGLKVGVVGVIGKSQITSISSQLVQDICFTDHIKKVQEISDFLRVYKGCDVIIASTHESSGNLYDSTLSNISNVSHKRYADLVLSGHAHYKQEYTTNGTKFVQWDSNGQSTGLITLKYDFANNKVVDDDTEVNTYYPNYIKTYYPTIDPTIEKMVDDYLAETNPAAEEILSSNFIGYWSSTSLGYLMSEAIFYTVKNMGFSADFAVCNYARISFNSEVFTYRDLYKCFPFDNQVILMDVSSPNSCSSISANETYREDTSIELIAGNEYKVAVIDYLALHQNESRQYNYFPDATNIYVLSDSNEEPLIYRNILKDYLKNNPVKTFNSSDYNSSNPHCL